MWSDSLLALERVHFQRLAVWGLLALVVGAILSLFLMRRDGGALLARHFATQTAAIGGLVAAWAGSGLGGLELRDHAGAVRLDTAVDWVSAVAAFFATLGAALALRGWLRRRPGLSGIGLALVLHGVILLILHRVFASQIVV